MITHEVIPTASKIFLGRQGENNARQILFKPHIVVGGVQESLSCCTNGRAIVRPIQ